MVKFAIFALITWSSTTFAQFSISPTPSSGQIELNTLPTQTITLVNTGSSDQVMNISLAPITDNLNGFSISVNRCLGKTLKKNQSCYFIVSFNKNSVAPSSNRSVQVKNGSSDLVVLYGSNSVVLNPASYSASLSSLNFGSLLDNTRSSSPQSITITNNGQLKGTPIIEIPNGVSIVLNRCSSGIEAGKSCQVSFTFKSSLSLVPQSGQNYSGNILIKKDISDASPVPVSIAAILSSYCDTGFEFSQLLSSCVDVRPQLTAGRINFLNPTAFPAVPNTQTLGLFTATMNAGMDINLFKKDPKGGTLTYQVQTGPSLGSLTTLTKVDQAGIVTTFPTASQYFNYPSNTLFNTGNPYFRLFFPYDSAAGTKHIYIKITATSSVSGFSNSIVLHSAYQNDLKFPYLRSEVSANTSQTTIREITPTLVNNGAGNVVSGYRDIIYINPSQNLIKFKVNVPDTEVVNSYASNNNSKIQIMVSEGNIPASTSLFATKLLAFYEYDSGTEVFSRKNTLDEPQTMNCVLGEDVGEDDGAICTLSKANLANEMAGKVLQLRIRLFSPETLMARELVYSYLVVKNISGTPCASAADPIAAPFHGIKVVDLNGDGKIQATDVYNQICTATQLRSLSYGGLLSPQGFARRFTNNMLEADIDMAPYYSGGGYKFALDGTQGIFNGQNHKISNFIVDVNDNTKNNSTVTTNESTIGANLPVGAGTFSGTGSQSQLGVFRRFTGAGVSNLILENAKVMGNGWTNVGILAGAATGLGVNSPNGRVDLGTLTTDNNSSVNIYNKMTNVHVVSTGVGGDSKPLSRAKGSTNVGGIIGSSSGDSVANVVVVPYRFENSSVDSVYVDSDQPFTQGGTVLGGFIGSSRGSILNRISAQNIHFRENSGGGGGSGWLGGISGYDTASQMSNIFVNGITVVGHNSYNLTVGGVIGTAESKASFGPDVYYPTKSNISNVFVLLEADNTLWDISGNSLFVGGLFGAFRNGDVSNSVAVGDLNVASMVPNFTGQVGAGRIAAFINDNGPNVSTISNVETFYQAPGPLHMYRCGYPNAVCDSNPEIHDDDYFTGYFNHIGMGYSPAIQSWDFTNIWRGPQGAEMPDLPYLRP